MRKSLEKINEVRSTFIGTFSRSGVKSSFGYTKPTLLLVDVRDQSTGEIVTDHLWFNLTKGFEALNLSSGDVVQFDARVKPYQKGYLGRRDDVWDKEPEIDYKLSHPTKIKKV
jgi:hypothetical protein